ncbi:MAG: helix-turn-helix domain-containing protein [Propionibacteriaceae bacterium]|jgi:plasmid maintenance system antidote protein VapI|nr:helix-turn-helix domain-containing protein [Propionibacteriaceae bacterium]
MNETFSLEVAALMRQKGIAQSDLAQAMGVSLKSLVNLLTGERSWTFALADKAGAALGVDARDLLAPVPLERAA